VSAMAAGESRIPAQPTRNKRFDESAVTYDSGTRKRPPQKAAPTKSREERRDKPAATFKKNSSRDGQRKLAASGDLR